MSYAFGMELQYERFGLVYSFTKRLFWQTLRQDQEACTNYPKTQTVRCRPESGRLWALGLKSTIPTLMISGN
jgi:hypothetical protein